MGSLFDFQSTIKPNVTKYQKVIEVKHKEEKNPYIINTIRLKKQNYTVCIFCKQK